MMQNKISDIERRIQKLETALRYSLLSSLQLEGTTETPTPTALFEQVGGTQVTIPIAQDYGYWSRPMPQSSHLVVNVAGFPGRGVSIASNDERYRPLNMLPGDVYMGDNTTQHIWITNGDTINVVANGQVNITAPTKVMITSPNVEISGNLRVDGVVIAGSNTGNQVGLQTHTHQQPSDGHGDAEYPTYSPTPGT